MSEVERLARIAVDRLDAHQRCISRNYEAIHRGDVKELLECMDAERVARVEWERACRNLCEAHRRQSVLKLEPLQTPAA